MWRAPLLSCPVANTWYQVRLSLPGHLLLLCSSSSVTWCSRQVLLHPISLPYISPRANHHAPTATPSLLDFRALIDSDAGAPKPWLWSSSAAASTSPMFSSFYWLRRDNPFRLAGPAVPLRPRRWPHSHKIRCCSRGLEAAGIAWGREGYSRTRLALARHGIQWGKESGACGTGTPTWAAPCLSGDFACCPSLTSACYVLR